MEENLEKKKALEVAMSQIEKQFGLNFRQKS